MLKAEIGDEEQIDEDAQMSSDEKQEKTMTDQNPMRIAEEMRRRLQHVPADDKLWVGIEESMDGLCSVAELLALADALDEERRHADRLEKALKIFHDEGCEIEACGYGMPCKVERLLAERRNS